MKKHIITRKNGNKITFIGVNHEKSLENNEITKIIQGNNKILLEENVNLNNKDLMKKFEDGKVYDKTSINIHGKLLFKQKLDRISGWDFRPTYLKNNTQDNLYNSSYFEKYTINEINKYYINPIPFIKKKYSLNKNIMGMFDYMNQNGLINEPLKKLIKEKKMHPDFAKEFHKDLKKDHAYMADSYVLNRVLPQYKDQDITIIAGEKHFHYLINHFKD